MTRIGIIGLTAFAFLCSAQLAAAADAPPVKKDAAAEPHWYDAVAGKKYFSLEGSSAQLSLAEDGLSLDIAAPDGSSRDKLYIYINDELGSIYDAADKNDAIGVFRQDDSGIEAQYADGHSETLSANSAGGLSVALTAPDDGISCMRWYPEGHVFSETERRAALDAYASKLGLAARDRKPAQAGCTAEASAALMPPAKKPSFRVARMDAKQPAGPIVVRTAEERTIDADAPAVLTPASAVVPMAGTALAAPQPAEAPAEKSLGASSCLSIDTDGANWGFRNGCTHGVQFAYCMQNGSDRSMACGSGTAYGGVGAKSFFPLLGLAQNVDDDHQFRWVACSGEPGEVTPHLDRSAPPAGRCVRGS